MKRNTKKAFNWIVKILQKHKISFEITGGLAARVYGSKRKLADIDIEIPNKRFEDLLPYVQKQIESGPRRYHDHSFNLLLMTLKYDNQLIDISGASDEKIYDKKHRHWLKDKIDFSKAILKKIFEHIVPVESKKELIKYKSRISRKVDKEDLSYINK
jgi:hypothetical protein